MLHQLGHQEHNRISNKLPIIGITAVVVILIGLIFMSQDKYRYQISTDDMLKILLERKDLVKPGKFMEIYYNNDSLYRFIDLRSSPEYLEGHIKNAIHIPLHKVLDDKYKDIFDQDEKINILYHKDLCNACTPWMVLKQLGYRNNKILIGGYDYVKASIIDEYKPMTGNYSNEKAKYDYAKIINETSSGGVSQEEPGDDAPANIIVVKKEKKSQEGGC